MLYSRSQMSKKRKPLGTPIPLRLSSETRTKADLAMRESGLSRTDVLRRAIDFGLPQVLARFSHKEQSA